MRRATLIRRQVVPPGRSWSRGPRSGPKGAAEASRGTTVTSILVVGLALALAGCPDPVSPPGVELDLSVPATAPAPRIPLLPVTLASQADFDALEARFEHRDSNALIAVLERLAATAKPGERPEDALLLMRLAVLYRDTDAANAAGAESSGLLKKALAIGTRLRAEAPASPHTLFLQGYIPYAFLGGRADRQLWLDVSGRDFASAVRDQWATLLTIDPQYDGPRELDHTFLARVVADLRRAIELLASPPEPGREPAPPTAVDRSGVEVLNTWLRFQSATEGDRKVLCRDWERTREAEEAPTRGVDELTLDLACATLGGHIETAVRLIVALRDLEGPAFDPCLAVARLGDRADPDKVREAAVAAGLACAP